LLLLVCAPYGVSQVSAADLVAVSLKAEIAERSIPDHYSSLARGTINANRGAPVA